MSPRFWPGEMPAVLKACIQAIFKRYSNAMQTKFSRVINFLYGPYFKVVGFFYRIFSANRARVERLRANQTFSAILKGFTVLVLVGWILIWMFASDQDRTRLVDEVRQSIGVSIPQATSTEGDDATQ
jgi:hypothetical protein